MQGKKVFYFFARTPAPPAFVYNLHFRPAQELSDRSDVSDKSDRFDKSDKSDVSDKSDLSDKSAPLPPAYFPPFPLIFRIKLYFCSLKKRKCAFLLLFVRPTIQKRAESPRRHPYKAGAKPCAKRQNKNT